MPSTLFFYTLCGLIIGSFLNVCIYRIPRRESIAFPGSHCPGCDRPIRPIDNIPVLSYLLLRGRCHSCGMRISLQYPIVEILAGLAFYSCALRWSFTAPTFVNSIFIAVVIVLFFTDYWHQTLPNVLTLPGIVAGVILSPFQDPAFYSDGATYYLAGIFAPSNPGKALPWTGSLWGALVGSGILFAVAWIYQAFRKKQGLGMGDVKMMAFVGAFLGWRLAFLTIFAGSLLGSVLGIFLVMFRGKNMQAKLAFGTFLGFSAVASLFFGLRLLEWYLTGH